MAEGRQEAAWGRTSAILAMLAEANRDKKKKPTPFKPDDFNPFAGRHRRREPAPPKVGIEALKVFV